MSPEVTLAFGVLIYSLRPTKACYKLDFRQPIVLLRVYRTKQKSLLGSSSAGGKKNRLDYWVISMLVTRNYGNSYSEQMGRQIS